MVLPFAQPQVECHGSVGAPPCRSLQPLRPGQPAARVGPFQLSSPAPASTRKKVVATASRRKTTASNNLDPLSRARPWSALPRCCVNIAVRVAPTEQASRASLFSWAWGRGCMPWICGHGAPRRGGEGARSRCLRRPTTTMPGGGRAVKTGRTRPCPMPHWSRDGMSEAPVKELTGAERMESAATRARAASSAPPRAAILGQPRPPVREYRRARSTA